MHATFFALLGNAFVSAVFPGRRWQKADESVWPLCAALFAEIPHWCHLSGRAHRIRN